MFKLLNSVLVGLSIVTAVVTYAKNYDTETINKNSYVKNTFGGIEKANIIRSFRDDILLKSEVRKSICGIFL